MSYAYKFPVKLHLPKSFFSERAESYVRLSRWALDESLMLATERMLEGINANVLLDVGVGNGALLDRLSHFQKKIGVDISLEMLRQNENHKISRLNADAHNLPIKNSVVDLAICRQVIHYCRPPVLLREIHRILKTVGLLHIVQLTDYDKISDEWYKYWVDLRRVVGRTRISRSALIGYAESEGFVTEQEESCLVDVSHSWDEFFEKNRVSQYDRGSVMEFFRNAPLEVKEIMKLTVSDEGLSYTRRFSLFLFRVNKKED